MDNDKPKKSGWWIVNLVIGIILVPCSCFILLWTLSVAGLFPYFFIVLLILFILIPVFSIINRKSGICRIALWTARIAFVLTVALYAFIPFVGMSFEHIKIFYVPKKLIYTYGVYSPPYTITEMLPKHLPDECRGYKFKTELGSIAQDYHPSVYLMFYTDRDTIAEYEEFFSGLPDCEKSDEIGSRMRQVVKDGKYSYITYVQPEAFPNHAFTWLDDIHKEEFLDMRNAVVYRKTKGYYGRGCLLDHDSGLVIYWT